MKPTVYIETTIPSYYWDERTELTKDIARTREWWDQERGRYDCYISVVVLEELQNGDYPSKTDCLNIIDGLPLLEVTPRIIEIADVYQSRQLMPKPPVRDAYHVALASYYRMDYLLTWNCKHLANANKIPYLESVNQKMALSTPMFVTPEMLRIWEGE